MALTDAQSRDIALALANIESSGTQEEQLAAIAELRGKYDSGDFRDAVVGYAAQNGLSETVQKFYDDEETFNTIESNVQRQNFLQTLPKNAEKTQKQKELFLVESEQAIKEGEELVAAIDQTEGTTGSEFISLTSQTHQCILTHFMDVVKEFHQKEVAGKAERGSSAGNQFLADRLAPSDGNETAKIILVDDSNPDAGSAPINTMTSLGKTEGLNDIGPDVIAALMPSLRLYKIYRDEGEEKSKVEFKFDNHTDSGFLDGTSGEVHLPGMTGTSKAKGRGAGIKSFNWSFIGGDPFTATRDLTATLSIFFQDFRDLTMERTGINLFGGKSESIPYHYLDLVVQPDCRSNTESISSIEEPDNSQAPALEDHNPECYEIAVEVGYAPSRDLDFAGALGEQTDTLYLTMVEHSFEIGQDGTFELKIEYRARLASLLGDKGMNILMPGGGRMIKTKHNDGSLIWDVKATEDMIADLESKKDKDETDSVELQKLRKLKGWLVSRRNNSIYAGMIEQLLQQKLLYKIEVKDALFSRFTNFNIYDRDRGKLRGIDDISQNEFKLENIEKIGAGDSEFETREEVQGAIEEGVGDDPVRSANDTLIARNLKSFKRDIYFTTLGNIITIALEHVLGENSILPEHWTVSERKLLEEVVSEEVNPTAKPESSVLSPTNNTVLQAVGLQDTTEEDAAQKQDQDKLNLGITTYIGGPEGMVDGRTTAGQDFNIGIATIDDAQKALLKNFRVILDSLVYANNDGATKAINLAHLPVSIEMFREFMIRKVISSQRNFYSFQDFSKDLLTDIVLDSISKVCFGGYDGKGANSKAGISLLTAHGVVENPSATSAKYLEPISSNTEAGIYRDYGSGYKTLRPDLARQDSPIFTTITSNKAPAFSYMVFSAFSTSIMNSQLHGNEEEDTNKGIAHFGYGYTGGLLKSVDFTKTPIEYLAEERYVREGTDNLLNQLAGRYEMQMNLVGNNLFIPGQYVYFNPVALGIGKPYENDGSNRSLANLMGLGGYHIITEVGCSIAPGKFETTIKALWETGGTMPSKTEET